MERRNFLRAMLGVAAVTALPSEVWPFKKIFLPSADTRIDVLDLSQWGKSKYGDVIALELEHFAKEIPDLYFRSTPFYDLIKKRGNVMVGDVSGLAIHMSTDLTFNGLSRATYPGRLSVPLRRQNILHAPATPENVMEFIDDLEDLSKRES